MNKKVDLLKGHIFTSLTELAFPIMISALIQMAYNLTDMAWIGIAGAPAVAAVGAGGMYVWLSQGVVALAKMGGTGKGCPCPWRRPEGGGSSLCIRSPSAWASVFCTLWSLMRIWGETTDRIFWPE